MMAPVRRYTHLVGAAMYAVVYGLIHTAAILAVMIAVLPATRPDERELRERRGRDGGRLASASSASG